LTIDLANPCGGTRSDPETAGCFDAKYSPDGKQIAFTVNIPAGQVRASIPRTSTAATSTSSFGGAEKPDWGTRPAN
jgi:hypothetical protein